MLTAVVMSNRMAQERNRRAGGFGEIRRANTYSSQRVRNPQIRRSATNAMSL